MNYTKLPKKVLLLLATPVMLSLAVPASKLVAQSQTETKIRLMAEASALATAATSPPPRPISNSFLFSPPTMSLFSASLAA